MRSIRHSYRAALAVAFVAPLIALGILSANTAAAAIPAPVLGSTEYAVEMGDTLIVDGMTAPETIVEITAGAVPLCTVVSSDTGFFTCGTFVANTDLDAGSWTISATATDGVETSPAATAPLSIYYPAPVVTSVGEPSSGPTFLIEGTGVAYRGAVDVFALDSIGSNPLCEAPAIVDPYGHFTCVAVTERITGTTAGYAAFQYSRLNPPPATPYSEPSSPIELSVDPYQVPPPVPTVSGPGPGTSFAFEDQPITVTGGGGLPSIPGITVTIVVTVETDEVTSPFCSVTSVTNTAWSCTGTVILPPGTHTLQATQTTPGETPSVSPAIVITILPPAAVVVVPTPTVVRGQPVVATTAVTTVFTQREVTEPQPAIVALPEQEEAIEAPVAASDTSPASTGGSSDDGVQPGDPSWLTDALITPEGLMHDSRMLVTGGVFGLGIVAAVIIAGEFFGESIAKQYTSITSFFRRQSRVARASDAVGRWVSGHRVVTGLGLVLATGVAFSFADPTFGLDVVSIRVMLSCVISIFLINFASNQLTAKISARAWGLQSRLELMPWGLFIAVVGVLVSRALDFSPGFLVGAIIGLSVLGSPGPRLESRSILLHAAIVWALSIGSWFAIGLVPVGDPRDPASFWSALLTDSLVATSAAGLTALLVTLLPISLLDGGVLFSYSRLAWVATFAITAVSFVIIVLPDAANWKAINDAAGPWMSVAFVFVAVALITYIIARTRAKAHAPKEPAAKV